MFFATPVCPSFHLSAVTGSKLLNGFLLTFKEKRREEKRREEERRE
jgi:hypothetical protein